MAEISKGILGGFSGKVGTVVGANWRGKNIIRSLPTKKKRTSSELQLMQRAKFKLVAQFMAPLNQLTSKYFGHYQGAKSRTNLAMSHHLLEAVEEQNGTFSIDYSKVVVSKGILPAVVIGSSVIENNELKLTWISNAGVGLAKPTDKLVAVVYSESNNMFYVIEDMATRADEVLTAAIPADWTGTDNSVWICFVVEKGSDCSSSMYLGAM